MSGALEDFSLGDRVIDRPTGSTCDACSSEVSRDMLRDCDGCGKLLCFDCRVVVADLRVCAECAPKAKAIDLMQCSCGTTDCDRQCFVCEMPVCDAHATAVTGTTFFACAEHKPRHQHIAPVFAEIFKGLDL
jgi:hypothetical protein